MKTAALHVFGGSALLLAAACSGNADTLSGGDNPGGPPGAGTDGGPDAGGAPLTCGDPGKPYMGFAGTPLVADRVDGTAGSNRDRMKPYSALLTEYRRVLGSSPPSLAADGPTFGQPQARWYAEPEASAISLYAGYSAAFEGCLTFVASPPQFAAAPTAASAATECTTMARKFWSRDATPDEVKACVAVATGLSGEPDAHRKWAYTCASVLTSAGFVTY